MTTSTYNYLTTAALEAATGIDYSVINAKFSDVAIEARITYVEELINGILGVSTAQTVTNQITSAVKFGAAWMMNYAIANLGHRSEGNPAYDIAWATMYTMLEKILLRTDSTVGVDSIPMSGATRY